MSAMKTKTIKLRRRVMFNTGTRVIRSKRDKENSRAKLKRRLKMHGF